MNLPPRKPKFSINSSHRSAALRGPGEPDLAIPVSGARVGSVARPVEDGARQSGSAGGQPAGYGLKPRFGLRAHTSALRVGPADEPTGPIATPDHEVA